MIILRNKLFARRDYIGLNQAEADALRAKRTEYARKLRKNYRVQMGTVDTLEGKGFRSVESSGNFTAGDVHKAYNTKTIKKLFESDKGFINRHRNRVRESMADNKDANRIWRRQVMNDSSINHSGPATNKYAGNEKALKLSDISTKKLVPTKKDLILGKLGTKGKIGLGVAAAGLAAGAGILANKKLKKGKKEKTFSKEEKGDDAKLKKIDKRDLWMYKHSPKYFKKIDKLRAEGDYKIVPKEIANLAAAGGLGAAVGGGILGKMSGTGVLKSAGKSAAAGAGIGAIAGGVGSASGIALQRAIRKKSKKYDDAWTKARDLYRVGDGEMSKKDFVNKWYKKGDE